MKARSRFLEEWESVIRFFFFFVLFYPTCSGVKRSRKSKRIESLFLRMNENRNKKSKVGNVIFSFFRLALLLLYKERRKGIKKKKKEWKKKSKKFAFDGLKWTCTHI